MKKQIIISLFVGIMGALLALMLLYSDENNLFILLIAFLVLIALIPLVIFYFQMFSKLNRAKMAGQDKLLENAYNYRVISLIITIINAFLPSGIISMVVEITGIVFSLLSVKMIIDYIVKFENMFGQGDNIHQMNTGYQYYIYSVGVDVVLSTFIIFSNSITILLIMLIIKIIVSITVMYGQYLIANNMILLFEKVGVQYHGPRQYGRMPPRGYSPPHPMGPGYSQMGPQTYPAPNQSPYAPQHGSREPAHMNQPGNYNPYNAPVPQSPNMEQNPFSAPQNNTIIPDGGVKGETYITNGKDISAGTLRSNFIECKFCKNKVPSNASFCQVCGAPLNK